MGTVITIFIGMGAVAGVAAMVYYKIKEGKGQCSGCSGCGSCRSADCPSRKENRHE